MNQTEINCIINSVSDLCIRNITSLSNLNGNLTKWNVLPIYELVFIYPF